MERGINSSMLSFDTVNIHTVESLFQSEGVFWLTTAVATGLAAEEVEIKKLHKNNFYHKAYEKFICFFIGLL